MLKKLIKVPPLQKNEGTPKNSSNTTTKQSGVTKGQPWTLAVRVRGQTLGFRFPLGYRYTAPVARPLKTVQGPATSESGTCGRWQVASRGMGRGGKDVPLLSSCNPHGWYRRGRNRVDGSHASSSGEP